MDSNCNSSIDCHRIDPNILLDIGKKTNYFLSIDIDHHFDKVKNRKDSMLSHTMNLYNNSNINIDSRLMLADKDHCEDKD